MGATTSSRVVGELEPVSAHRYPFEDPGLAIDPPIISNVLIVWREFGRFAISNSMSATVEFEKVGIGFGAVMWANGLDLAPDAMYEEFKRNGVWVLR